MWSRRQLAIAAYLTGALRDGSIVAREGHDYEVRILQKEAGWLRLLNELFEEAFGIRGKIYMETRRSKSGVRTYYVLRIFDKELLTRLIYIFEIEMPQKFWKTPTFIKNSRDKEVTVSYIRGFFDAEGGLPRDVNTAKQYYISFDQANEEPLEFIRSKLIELGYTPTNLTRTGKVYQFRLCRKDNIVKFCREIGSWHPEKKLRLEAMCTRIDQPPFFNPPYPSLSFQPPTSP